MRSRFVAAARSIVALCVLAGLLAPAAGCGGRRRSSTDAGTTRRDAGGGGPTDGGMPPPVDAGGACVSPRMMCGEVCADLSSDESNCGFCGNPCETGMTCTAGDCVAGGTGRAACASPGTIPAGGGSTTVDLASAPNDGYLGCGSSTPGGNRAYTWTPSTSGTATITASGMRSDGGEYDTVLAVYSSAPCASDAQLDCNDDSTGLSSMISLPVTAGTRYYIVVESFSDPAPAGTVTLSVMLGAG